MTAQEAWNTYRPSNGTEGMIFMERWCFQCAREKRCPILTATFLYDEDDVRYPKEWIRKSHDDEWPGTALCTGFIPRELLSVRARMAWDTRRRMARQSCADLFATEATKMTSEEAIQELQSWISDHVCSKNGMACLDAIEAALAEKDREIERLRDSNELLVKIGKDQEELLYRRTEELMAIREAKP